MNQNDIKINSIEIKNIKGIKEKIIPFEIVPNKINIFVAPNGFGKTSITVAFKSLMTKSIRLEKKDCYNEDESLEPSLRINFEGSNCLVADANINELNKNFRIRVINNDNIHPKGVFKKIKGNTVYSTVNAIDPVYVINSIPESVALNYNFIDLSLKNIRSYLKYIKKYSIINILYEKNKQFESLFYTIKWSRFSDKLKICKYNIAEFENYEEELNKIKNLNSYKTVCKVIDGLDIGPKIKSFNITVFIAILEEFYKINRKNFYNYIKREKYKKEKKEIKTLFDSINYRSNLIKLQEKNGLAITFPKFYLLSNGERDTFNFMAQILKQKIRMTHFRDLPMILIIDEIFDYMDSINLIIVQDYLQQIINEMKKDDRIIYPIIMTHNDPELFKCYKLLSNTNIIYEVSNNLFDKKTYEFLLSRKKNDEKINSELGIKGATIGFFHFCPFNIVLNIDEQNEIFRNYCNSYKYENYMYDNLKKYIDEEECDFFSVCNSLRYFIEKYIYYSLLKRENHIEFLLIHGTKNKIEYAKSKEIMLPDYYSLLQIFYDDIMHICEHKKSEELNNRVNFLKDRLNNLYIKNIIRNLFNDLKIDEVHEKTFDDITLEEYKQILKEKEENQQSILKKQQEKSNNQQELTTEEVVTE